MTKNTQDEQIQNLRPTRSRTLRSTAMAGLRRGCTILSPWRTRCSSVLYPGIKVASVNVPTEPLDDFEESQVENALARLIWNGIHYKLVGASGSAKKGKFYFVDQEHSRASPSGFSIGHRRRLSISGFSSHPAR